MWRVGGVSLVCIMMMTACGVGPTQEQPGLKIVPDIVERRAQFVERYGTVHPAMTTVLASMTDLPVDIDPVYPLQGLQ